MFATVVQGRVAVKARACLTTFAHVPARPPLPRTRAQARAWGRRYRFWTRAASRRAPCR